MRSVSDGCDAKAMHRQESLLVAFVLDALAGGLLAARAWFSFSKSVTITAGEMDAALSTATAWASASRSAARE